MDDASGTGEQRRRIKPALPEKTGRQTWTGRNASAECKRGTRRRVCARRRCSTLCSSCISHSVPTPASPPSSPRSFITVSVKSWSRECGASVFLRISPLFWESRFVPFHLFPPGNEASRGGDGGGGEDGGGGGNRQRTQRMTVPSSSRSCQHEYVGPRLEVGVASPSVRSCRLKGSGGRQTSGDPCRAGLTTSPPRGDVRERPAGVEDPTSATLSPKINTSTNKVPLGHGFGIMAIMAAAGCGLERVYDSTAALTILCSDLRDSARKPKPSDRVRGQICQQ